MSSIFSRENLLRWLLGIGCFALVLFFFSPPWAAFALSARVPELSGMIEVRRGMSVLAQVAHPGAPIEDPLHQVVQWRLLFPVIGHVLGLAPVPFFGLAYIGCAVALGYVVTLLRRAGFGWSQAALGTIAIGAASWVFVSTGWLGYFDSWVALALLIAAFARSRWSVWAACLWAPWVDERFVMALPVALLCRWLNHTLAPAAQDGDTVSATEPAAPPFDWRLEFGIPAALLAVFLFVRLGLLSDKSASNATLVGYFVGKNYLDAPSGRIALGVWEGLRGGWVLVILAILALRRRPALAALLGVAVVVTVFAGLATAQDYSRSMTMLLPVAVGGLLWSRPLLLPAGNRLLGMTAAAALLLPAHHVMNDAVNPIRYLYHELAAFDTPPATAMPELRELRAIHEMEQGDYAAAEADLTLAIKLSDNPASPAKQRGVLYASGHRWEQAKRDFTTVVQNDPENPDGWFLRAQVELAMRDTAAARADFEHARSIAPAGWANRPDVMRFSALFNQQAGRP